MLRTGDKIKYAKENSMLNIPLGTIFTVTDVAVNAIYMDTEMELGGMRGVAKCVMSYDEYEKYFEKVVEEPKHTWTEWRVIKTDELYHLIHNLEDNYFIVKYLKHYLKESTYKCLETRNNGKKTDVRITFADTTTKATSTCNITADDTFDEATGIQVALIRLFAKQAEKISKFYIEKHY